MSSKITLKNGPGIPKKAGSTILAPGEPGWSTDLEKLYVGTADPQAPAMVGKPDDHVNVKYYGAKGDGVTDDQPAITRAITAGLASNLPVFFPPGNYHVASSAASIPKVNILLYGSSPYKCKITQSGKSTHLIDTTDTSSAVEIHDLEIKRSTTILPTYGAFFNNVKHLTLIRSTSDVNLSNSASTIREHYCYGNMWVQDTPKQLRVVSNGKYTPATPYILPTSSSSTTLIRNCTIDLSSSNVPPRTRLDAMFISSDGGVHFDGCTFDMGTNDLTGKNIIGYSDGTLSIERCVFNITDKLLHIVGSGSAFGISTLNYRGFTWRNNHIAAGREPSILIDVSKCNEMANTTISGSFPRSKIKTKTPLQASQNSIYEHCIDGIWWNGHKITP